MRALAALVDSGTATVLRLSRLYESAPAYVTEQPSFLNAAAVVETQLKPEALLTELKRIEKELGRDLGGLRWGPRPIDLDIIFYEDGNVVRGDTLVIPHPRWQERDFVKAPLADLHDDHPTSCAENSNSLDLNIQEGVSDSNHEHTPLSKAIRQQLALANQLWEAQGGEACLGHHDLRCVIPCGRFGVIPWQTKTYIMGVLNVTPDSFSDGGRYMGHQQALEHARELVHAGADILDVGGQSTRPGASIVSPEEEKARILPIIKSLCTDPVTSDIPISVDTFDASTAKQAVEAGAAIINDVSGGTLDSSMFGTVAELRVPYVLMHMRGNPQTMLLEKNKQYFDVVGEVSRALRRAAEKAIDKGVLPWQLILDPGLGFAKDSRHNLMLIAGLERLRYSLPRYLRGLPLLLGPSRKRFLGELTERTVAEQRDWATAAASALCVAHGANFIRAHNVEGVRDACKVADAVRRVNESCVGPSGFAV